MSNMTMTLDELLDELLATGNFPGRAEWIASVRAAIAEQPRPVASNPLGRLHSALASAERIDVLGVLSDCASEMPSHESDLELMEAREAVADVLSAAQELCRASDPSYSHLLAAASDLLEALQLLMQKVQCGTALNCEICDQARAAIAKARGGA